MLCATRRTGRPAFTRRKSQVSLTHGRFPPPSRFSKRMPPPWTSNKRRAIIHAIGWEANSKSPHIEFMVAAVFAGFRLPRPLEISPRFPARRGLEMQKSEQGTEDARQLEFAPFNSRRLEARSVPAYTACGGRCDATLVFSRDANGCGDAAASTALVLRSAGYAPGVLYGTGATACHVRQHVPALPSDG